MTPVRVAMRAAAPRRASGDCGCGGCGEKTSRCCGAECLVRPNFYCGQLLNDTDLSAMVQWARDRFALSRYRDGWGVVCGLEVTCRTPEGAGAGDCGCGCGGKAKKATLWVDAGYAVDCCGNDLVVCDPIPVDLDALCRPADDPCADPCDPPGRQDRPVRGKDFPFGNTTIPREDLVVADLLLVYGEQRASGQRPMFGGSCADQDACEYSRVRETPKVMLVPSDDDPIDLDQNDVNPAEPDPELQEYVEKLQQEAQDVFRRIIAMLQTTDPATLIESLGKWPIYSECFVVDWVRQLRVLSPADRMQVALWLYLDWATHLNVCRCTTCRTDTGVPLARVVLWRKRGRTECCRPLLVIPRPPFRRELRRDCYSLTEIGRLLRTLGRSTKAVPREMNVSRDPIEITTDEALETKDFVFTADPGERLVPYVVRDFRNELRIVGYRRERAPDSGPEDGPTGKGPDLSEFVM